MADSSNGSQQQQLQEQQEERREEMRASKPQRCQRIGCDEFFTEEDNEDGSCCYHPGQPIFHDGNKEWSCCKAKSYDFSLFLALPGCARGRHTLEKPQPPQRQQQQQPTQQRMQQASAASTVAASAGGGAFTATAAAASARAEHGGAAAMAQQASSPAMSCGRCRGGYYCAEHAPLSAAAPLPEPKAAPLKAAAAAARAAPPPKWDLSALRTCRRKGCGKEYRERDNHDSACKHHPGPAVFHDRKKGWACCNVMVTDFDEFLGVPPCATGWHDDHEEENSGAQ